jgi:hypothetical protein
MKPQAVEGLELISMLGRDYQYRQAMIPSFGRYRS